MKFLRLRLELDFLSLHELDWNDRFSKMGNQQALWLFSYILKSNFSMLFDRFSIISCSILCSIKPVRLLEGLKFCGLGHSLNSKGRFDTGELPSSNRYCAELPVEYAIAKFLQLTYLCLPKRQKYAWSSKALSNLAFVFTIRPWCHGWP